MRLKSASGFLIAAVLGLASIESADAGASIVGSVETLSAGDLFINPSLGSDHHIYIANANGGGYTFPDGNRDAVGAVLINAGASANLSYCASGVICPGVNITYGNFGSSTTALQMGASVVLGDDPTVTTNHRFFTENTASPERGSGNTLSATISGLNPNTTTDLVFYFNMDPNNALPSLSGCLTLGPSGSPSTPVLVTLPLGSGVGENSGNPGALLEFSSTGTSSVELDETVSNGACSSDGDIPLAAVFFSPYTPPTYSPVSQVRLRRAAGGWMLTWRSAARTLGFDVFDGRRKLNSRLVTSATRSYRLRLAAKPRHLRIVPVGMGTG